MTKDNPPRVEPVFPPESRRTQDERCKAGLEHNKPIAAAEYPDNGIKANGRPDDPFNDQCALDDIAKKYPDGMSRADGTQQGDE